MSGCFGMCKKNPFASPSARKSWSMEKCGKSEVVSWFLEAYIASRELVIIKFSEPKQNLRFFVFKVFPSNRNR
jgi:hypothetical protein